MNSRSLFPIAASRAGEIASRTASIPRRLGHSARELAHLSNLGENVTADPDGVRRGVGVVIRRLIGAKRTLRQIEQRWADNKPFLSASEMRHPADPPRSTRTRYIKVSND